MRKKTVTSKQPGDELIRDIRHRTHFTANYAVGWTACKNVIILARCV